jgi:hypothetical protein
VWSESDTEIVRVGCIGKRRQEGAVYGFKRGIATEHGTLHASLGGCISGCGICLLLGGPVHELVSDEHGDSPVEDLVLGSAVGVEDSGVCGTSESTLTVLGHGVGNDTTLRRGA